jgi:hypothetical protein
MSGSDIQRRLDQALRELERLRAENERLRTLLALAQGTRALINADNGDARGTSHVDSGASAAEKVALIRRLFRGRGDVHALRWENARTGKSGYVPATANGWTKTGPKTYLPLTDETIARHLQGRESIGIYPLLADDTCWFLACDFDGKPWRLDALALLEACAERDGPPGRARPRELRPALPESGLPAAERVREPDRATAAGPLPRGWCERFPQPGDDGDVA